MKQFKNILFYAGTEQNAAAISRSFELAMENEATLTLMDVVKPVSRAIGMSIDVDDPAEIEQQLATEHRKKLLAIAAEYLDTGVSIDVVVSVGDPAEEIVRQVLNDNHDLVVKTADGAYSSRRLFGTIGRSLLRSCPCPVWLLKPEMHGEFDRVLAAVDVEAEDENHILLNQKILKIAHSIAQREHAELHIVAAWDIWMEKSLRSQIGNREFEAVLARHESRVCQSLDDLLHVDYAETNDFHRHLLRGIPAGVILKLADTVKADLLVMGTVCRAGLGGFLIGSTADTVLGDVDCSVLALKPKGFVSPIEP
ncbi:MAG: universal stress protein [Pirellulaceae bacterium]